MDNKHLTATKDGRVVTIRTYTVGQNFGTAAKLVARNGRVIGRTFTYPLGFDACAIEAARRLAGRITKGAK